MRSETGLVSIVLPVYNGQAFLGEAIESIQQQTYPDWELIIIDDCSDDKSYVMGQHYAQADSRIRVLRNASNLKLPGSLNVGFREAKGDYLTWTSHDNVYDRRFLEIMKSSMDKSGSSFVYSDYDVFVNDPGCPTTRSKVEDPDNLIVGNCIGASFMYTSAVAKIVGEYSPHAFLYEDYEYWLRVYSAGFQMQRVEFAGYKYRRHSNQLSNTHRVPDSLLALKEGLLEGWPGSNTQIARGEIKLAADYLRILCISGALRVIFRGLTRHPVWISRVAVSVLISKVVKRVRRLT